MISEVVKQKIKRLLETGKLSQRDIARKVGVSNWTVAKVNNGKPVEIREKNRCSICGALVYGECYECSLKKAKKNGELAQVYDGPGRSLDLDLSKKEVERLEELRGIRRVQRELEEEMED